MAKTSKKYLIPIFTIVSTLVMLTFSACSKQENYYNIEAADQISMIYGVSSYMMVSADEDIIGMVIECLNDLQFTRSEKEMDILTMLNVNLSKDGESVARLSADSKGVFWIDGTAESYEISNGEFDYEAFKDLWEKK